MRARKILALAGCAALLALSPAGAAYAAETAAPAGVTESRTMPAGEQPAAAEFRAKLASGKFFVAYVKDGDPYRLTAQDGKRLLQTGRAGGKKADALRYKALYMDGKYYQFDSTGSKPFARVLPERSLTSSSLNPEEHWQDVPDDLALPEELRIFYADTAFAVRPPSLMPPVYDHSISIDVKGKTRICDLYLSPIRTQAGTDAGVIQYSAVYEDGKLLFVQKFLGADDNAPLLETVYVEGLGDEIPADTFMPKTEIPVYEAGTGGMNDLLGSPARVGAFGGGKADEK